MNCHRFKRVFGILFVLILTVCALCPVSVTATQERQTVRVGFFAFDGYHIHNENGSRSGYGYEILQHIAGYTDWKYEYIGYDKAGAKCRKCSQGAK